MTPRERFARADAILDALLDLPPAARAVRLDEACQGDAELRALVQRLLTDCDSADRMRAGGGLDGPLFEELADELEAVEPVQPGTIVDRYRVLREIGRGGMAVVYLAERADRDFDHRVALKLIKRGTDTGEVIRRFEQERRMLAQIRHAHIAQLLDGGASADGRPYFVMEYVPGLPIDRYCEEHRLGLTDRLRLFLQVAGAVDHAHRNLIVHRDIKPSNILVGEDGEARLLDFGIARFLRAEDDPALTRSQALLMTPAYASPEQVRGERVTTASDIYQLGLLLYGMLVGRGPYDVEGGTDAWVRAILEAAPLRPSAIQASVPSRALRGDLDVILLTALRKEPERRYASVAQLVDDLERHLEGRPIRARADTFAYRASKFVRRHTLEVCGGAAGIALIVALVVFYTLRLRDERDRRVLEAQRATESAQRATDAAQRAAEAAHAAEEVADFLVELFEQADPDATPGRELLARDLLDRGAARIRELLGAQPLTRARLLETLGRVYHRIGDLAAELPLLEEALALRGRVQGEDHPEAARVRGALAAAHYARGEFDAATAEGERAARALRAAQPGMAGELADVLAVLGLVHQEFGRAAASDAAYAEALAVLEGRPDGASRRAGLLSNRALLARTMGRPAEAVRCFEEALALERGVLGDHHSATGTILANLGLAHADLGHLDEAERCFTEALGLLEEILGRQHFRVATVLHSLGDLMLTRGQREQAEVYFGEAASIFEATLELDHPRLGICYASLAEVYLADGQPERAVPLYEQSVEIFEQAFGDQRLRLLPVLQGLARGLREIGEVARAREVEARSRSLRSAEGE